MVLSYLEMPNLEEVGLRFMTTNRNLLNIDFPKLKTLKYGFLKNLESNLKERTIIKITKPQRKTEKYDLNSIGGI